MKNNFNIRCLNGFWLKVLGMFFMTLDHVGLFLTSLTENEIAFNIGTIFRCFGRLALPIFIFLIAEGVRHTRNELKYLMRIGIIALCFLIGQIFIFYVSKKEFEFSSPMVDLFYAAITLILLKRKDKFSFLAIIPITFTILCFVTLNIANKNPEFNNFVPFVLRPDYCLFSMLLALGFYYAKPISIALLKSNDSTNALIDSPYQRYAESILCALVVVILSGIFYAIYMISQVGYVFSPLQIYTMFAAVLILLYSGKRGYNAKWFQIGCYIYMPLHLVVIAAIFLLI